MRLPIIFAAAALSLLPSLASAEYTFYDPEEPLKHNTTAACLKAFKRPLPSCSPLMLAFPQGGATYFNQYIPRPSLNKTNLDELCTKSCLKDLREWVQRQEDDCTDEDRAMVDDGWGGGQALYTMKGFEHRFYWNWCLQDLETGEYCLPHRASYADIPTGCTTKSARSEFCDDSCAVQSLLFVESVGPMGWASGTISVGKNIPHIHDVCPDVDLSKYDLVSERDWGAGWTPSEEEELCTLPEGTNVTRLRVMDVEYDDSPEGPNGLGPEGGFGDEVGWDEEFEDIVEDEEVEEVVRDSGAGARRAELGMGLWLGIVMACVLGM